jgi:biotin carboxyl carrier protein
MKKFKFNIGGKKYETSVVEKEDNSVEVTVNGKAYSVEVERETSKVTAPTRRPAVAPAASAPAPAAAPAAPSASTKTVNAPLPGNIIKIACTVGQAVKTGDVLVVMEAMKMENNIVAESTGTVKNIFVQQGQTVQSGDALVEVG